jgi:hypothetical protein
MADLRYFNALFEEHGAEPAELFFRDQESVTVIIRSFKEGNESIRLDIQAREGLHQQLVVSREGLRALANGAANLEGFLLVDSERPAVKVTATGLHDGDGVRLTVDEDGALEEQLLIHRNAVGRLADDPQDPLPHT